MFFIRKLDSNRSRLAYKTRAVPKRHIICAICVRFMRFLLQSLVAIKHTHTHTLRPRWACVCATFICKLRAALEAQVERVKVSVMWQLQVSCHHKTLLSQLIAPRTTDLKAIQYFFAFDNFQKCQISFAFVRPANCTLLCSSCISYCWLAGSHQQAKAKKIIQFKSQMSFFVCRHRHYIMWVT